MFRLIFILMIGITLSDVIHHHYHNQDQNHEMFFGSMKDYSKEDAKFD